MAQLDNFIRLREGELKPRDWKRLQRELTFFPNPDTRVWVWREAKHKGELWLPRGILDLIPDYIEFRDKRSFPKLPKLPTLIELDFSDEDETYEKQVDCLDAMFENQQGVIHRQPGTGKTEIALEFIARVGTRTLVIVHTKEILDQWITRAEELIPEIDIGIIAGGSNTIGQLTLATVQAITRRNYPVEWWRQFGATILDECHHAPAKTFDLAIAHCTSRYRFGMSASKKRADKMEPLIRYNFGKVIHDLEFASPIPVTVEKLNSNFRSKYNMSGPLWLRRRKWQGMIKALINDQKRNQMIAKRVDEKLAEGRSVLVLSRRIEHLQNIQRELAHESEIVAAKIVPKPRRREIVQQFRDGKIKCVLGTQLADEGLDVKRLSCVALTFPAKHTDLILQQVGRALREFANKDDAVIIDVVDRNVKTLRSQWHNRRGGYLRWGFRITGDGLRGRINPLEATVLRRGRKVRKAVVFGRMR